METLWVAGSSPVSPPRNEASSSVVEQRYLRFVEMHITFLFHSKACVVGSNPTLPPKKKYFKGVYKTKSFYYILNIKIDASNKPGAALT